MVVLRAVIVVGSAVAVACSGGMGANSAQTNLLIEGAGLETLRIGEATVADAASRLGLAEAERTKTFDNGLVEMRTPQLLRLDFLPPESGQGAAVLYAVRANLSEPVYTGKSSKGIGFLDSLEAVNEAYGPSDAEWVEMTSRIHYYAEHGVIITTRHPVDIPPKIYAAAGAALGKAPDDGPTAALVTGIIVVRPFKVTKAAETARARQQVISTRPKTTLRTGALRRARFLAGAHLRGGNQQGPRLLYGEDQQRHRLPGLYR